MLACDLTGNSPRDPARVPAVLEQLHRPISSVRADAAYDSKNGYEAIEAGATTAVAPACVS